MGTSGSDCHKRDVTAEALRLHAPLLGMGRFLYHLEDIEFQIIRFRHIPHLRWASRALRLCRRNSFSLFQRFSRATARCGILLYHLEDIKFQIVGLRHIPHLRWASRALRLRRRNSFSLFQLGCTRHSTVWGGFLYHLEDVELQIIRFRHIP